MERSFPTRDLSCSLWASSASDAFLRAIKAQPKHTPWCRLLSQATRHRVFLCRAKQRAGVDADPLPPAVAVVAGVVLSLPAHGVQPCAPPSSEPAEQSRYLCVSLGSGSRCVGVAPSAGLSGAESKGPTLRAEAAASAVALHDGHAEVLARRAFCAVLVDWMHSLADADAAGAGGPRENPFLSFSTASESNGGGRFSFKSGVRVTLLTTHWPCGSMALAATGETGGRLLLQTPLATLQGWAPRGGGEAGAVGEGAHSPASTTEVLGHVLAAHKCAEDADPRFHAAGRVKPGKGHRNLNMSCSDKLWRWSARGILPKAMAALCAGTPLKLSEAVVAAPLLGGTEEQQKRERDRAAEVLREKSRGLRLSGASVPHVSLFVCPPDEAAASWAPLVEGDSGCSRCAWLSGPFPEVGGTRVNLKRPRESGSDGGSTRHCPSFFSQLTLNMKAGLPQGMAVSALAKRRPPSPSGARDRQWVSQFPLSRAWLDERVEDLTVLVGARETHVEPSMAVWLNEAQREGSGRDADGCGGGQRLLWTWKPQRDVA